MLALTDARGLTQHILLTLALFDQVLHVKLHNWALVLNYCAIFLTLEHSRILLFEARYRQLFVQMAHSLRRHAAVIVLVVRLFVENG